jgi:O-antigen/teichoic acid export membrane protein
VNDTNTEHPLDQPSIDPIEQQATPWMKLLGRFRHLQTFALFSFATMSCSVSTMLAGLVILHWVDPQDIGLWQSLLMIQAYSLIVQGGVINGLNRELPYLMGMGNHSAVIELASTVQSIAVGGACLLLLGGVIVLFLPLETNVCYGAFAVLICSAGLLYRMYLNVTYRAERAFQTLAWIQLGEAGLQFITLPLVYYYHYQGLAARYLVLTLLGVILGHVYRPLHVPNGFQFRHVATVLKVGLPVFISGYFLGIAVTFPRAILLTESGVVLVGLFAPAYSVLGLMPMLPASMAQYLYPQMSYRLGKTGDPRGLWPMAWKTALGVGIISLPMLIVAMLAIPTAIEWFFPKYTESIPAVRWGIVAGVFIGASISVNALNSLKAWRWVAVYTCVQVGSAYLLPLLLFHVMSDPLEGVAAGYCMSQALSFTVGMVCIYRACHSNVARAQIVASP